jgi:hypothetical protein
MEKKITGDIQIRRNLALNYSINLLEVHLLIFIACNLQNKQTNKINKEKD